MTDTCKTCKYVREYDSEVVLSLSCNRYPPTVLIESNYNWDGSGNLVHSEYATSRYPEVNDDDWCGEYQAQVENDALTTS